MAGFEDLTDEDKGRITELYSSDLPRKYIQEQLAEELDTSPRTIRRYAKIIEQGLGIPNPPDRSVMIYDIETSRVTAKVWWTGKQYVGHSQLQDEAKIISIAWKWLGDDQVYWLTWDRNHCDKSMLKEFLKEYNQATMVVGQNNNSFDNKWIQTRAAKHNLHIDRFVRSLDIYRQARRYFRLPSYSMAYMATYFGLTPKQDHEGIRMWEMVENGSKKEQAEYLAKMVKYNQGDIVTTEELYLKLRPYFGTVTHAGAIIGKDSWCCPISGSSNVGILKTICTETGTLQRIMYCPDSKHQYKISNQLYMKFLEES